MPVYEYRCSQCQRVASYLVKRIGDLIEPACPNCGSRSMARVFSRFVQHKTEKTKLEELDPMYDKMIDDAYARNPKADPDFYLKRMRPFSDAESPGELPYDL